MKKLYWLFPIALIASSAILFLSFREVGIFYTLEGQVLDANNNPVFNAIITVDERDVEAPPYFEPTKPDGNFKLSFNAIEGKPIHLIIEKQNWGQVKKEIIPSSLKKYDDLKIQLGPDRSVTFHSIDPKYSKKPPGISASVVSSGQ